ncbi:MAG TPA: membrane dipeptidase [Methylomirabilota bacterium]|nr:membrane dipeptidase [Methylomirabilota bacterium]
MRRDTVLAAVGAATAGAAAAGLALRRPLGANLVARTERRLCRVHQPGPYLASEGARELHESLFVADLHADSLLWGRDLLKRGERGHVDVPRLIEGNVALQVMAASTKSPRHLNLDRNDDRSDDVLLLALALGWPLRTLRSLTERALFMAGRAHDLAARSDGRFRVIETAADLDAHVAARATSPSTATVLAIEGAHALDNDLDNVDRLFDAGYRMMSPSHFFDTPFGGSAHGIDKGGMTDLGREMIERMEARSMLLDLSHASPATIDDALAVARRAVVVSHTGVRGVADNIRNLTDEQVRGVAATGGVIGIGFWPTACGGEDAASIVRSIRYAVSIAGVEHVGLGSDFDGAVPVPFDATGMAQITEALLGDGFSAQDIGRIMGGNVLRLLRETLPATAAAR